MIPTPTQKIELRKVLNQSGLQPYDIEPLLDAIFAYVNNKAQAMAIARTYPTPGEFDENSRLLPPEQYSSHAKKGAQAVKSYVAGLKKEQAEREVTRQQNLSHFVTSNRVIGQHILSFLPFSTQSQVNSVGRRTVNEIRTGGLTGNLYEHIKSTPARLSYGSDARCAICRDRFPHLPELRESPQTRAMASLIVHAIKDSSKSKRLLKYEKDKEGNWFNRGYMLGVLRVNATVFIAISGSALPADLEAFINSLNYGTFVHDAPSRTTAVNREISERHLTQSSMNSPAALFMCAAPKLVGVARGRMSNPGATWSMTEMWCGPPTESREAFHAYESCSNCRLILPMMLCKSVG